MNKEKENKKYYQKPVRTDEQVIINDVIEKLEEAYQGSLYEQYLSMGRIIAQHIFDNSAEDIKHIVAEDRMVEYMTEPRIKKKRIFKYLGEELAKRSETGKLPSKTQIYNALRLFHADSEYKDLEGYAELSVSHKIELLKLNRNIDVERLVQKTNAEKLTVRALREEVWPLRKTKGSDDNHKMLMRLSYKTKSAHDIEHIKREIKRFKHEWDNHRYWVNYNIKQLEGEVEKMKELDAYISELEAASGK